MDSTAGSHARLILSRRTRSLKNAHPLLLVQYPRPEEDSAARANHSHCLYGRGAETASTTTLYGGRRGRLNILRGADSITITLQLRRRTRSATTSNPPPLARSLLCFTDSSRTRQHTFTDSTTPPTITDSSNILRTQQPFTFTDTTYYQYYGRPDSTRNLLYGLNIPLRRTQHFDLYSPHIALVYGQQRGGPRTKHRGRAAGGTSALHNSCVSRTISTMYY